jgi:hypothetical protein
MNAAGLRALVEDFDLVAPITIGDLGFIRDTVVAAVGADCSVDVTLRGTEDRKHDGDHRVVIVVDDARAELPVRQSC